ncbi:MAG: DUF3307 domain-containing protein [Candidatus Pacebacteria bacterium]|nr:DUF3307 domain-containing protein [Candidatus Paceibacterota bacterium]
MLQLIAHLIGDYMLQSGWMANNKTKRHVPALVHALVYFLPFYVIFRPSLAAAVVMIGTHFVIDRYRLARYVAFSKEFIAPPSNWPKWRDCSETGFHKDTPAFLAVWLMIIIDNAMHLVINALALAYL